MVHDHRFEEFTIPSLDDFVDGDRDELLLCPMRALKKYPSWMEQYLPDISNQFVSATEKDEQGPETPFRFGLDWSLTMHMHLLLRRIVICTVRVKAHEVQKIATLLLFRSKCWRLGLGLSRVPTFSTFYL